jgi:paraquat-inducible protein B
MGFNLHFADPGRQPRARRAPRPSRKIRLLPILGLCLAASLLGDVMLSSGRYSSLLVSDAGAGIVAGKNALRAVVYGR